ncbi:hypothetical protein [uncultured Paenibacillus sp.]|uniref:hypothetical protein n=1 Tax=uncultured Paenibacillus sp. TaxID=227322 RepID=UPI0015A96BDB|nr:hypothetical protein [uncultured Paenibacillus sp.]
MLYSLLKDGKDISKLTVAEVDKMSIKASSVGFKVDSVLLTLYGGSTMYKGTGNAFDVAKSGGKHSGFYNQYVGKSKKDIQKGIQSLDKQIAEHQDKIRNPEAHISNFKDLDPRQQEALVNKKWPSDIQRQMEQKEILEGILRSR